MTLRPKTTRVAAPRAAFPTTRWSMVLRARALEGDFGALEELCRACWFPVYSFIRRGGATPEDAQDLTQGFFAHLLERKVIDQADPERGRFRSFLLGALKLYLHAAERHRRAVKRGGGAPLLPLEFPSGEERHSAEPVTHESPDVLYDRRWAETLLERALERLRGDYERAGKAEFFDAISPLLSGADVRGARDALAARLGVEPGTLTVAVFRMRRRYAEILRDEVAQTVEDPADVEEEIRHLLRVVG